MVEILRHLLLIVKVKPIVELSEFQYYFNPLWFILGRETVMRLSAKYSLNALIDELGAERIESLVEGLVKFCLLR